MKVFLIVFLLIIINSECDFHTDFIDYLQQEGYYIVIQATKTYCGNDPAIEVCKGFVPSGLCTWAVKEYMSDIPSPKSLRDIEYLMTLLTSGEYFSILKKHYTESEIRRIINKIIIKFGGNPIYYITPDVDEQEKAIEPNIQDYIPKIN